MEVKNKKIVLQKYLSICGVASRRASEKLILDGKIKINDKIATLGDRVDPEQDVVTLNGKKIKYSTEIKRYIMLNKPRGFVTTMSDEQGRKCVADLVGEIPDRVYPAGRLDKDSEGLLIMTNDGEFANQLTHPSKNIWKTYRVTVKPNITENQLTALCTTTQIEGSEVQPAKINVITQEKSRAVLEISIKEGKNRQIRKMCESVGLEVARLKRINIGLLKLGMLKPGKWRDLTTEELKNFKLLFKTK